MCNKEGKDEGHEIRQILQDAFITLGRKRKRRSTRAEKKEIQKRKAYLAALRRDLDGGDSESDAVINDSSSD